MSQDQRLKGDGCWGGKDEMDIDTVADIAGVATLVLIPVALVVPELNALHGRLRPGVVWALALAPVLTFLSSEIIMGTRISMLRVELLIIPPFLIWVLINAAVVTYRMRQTRR